MQGSHKFLDADLEILRRLVANEVQQHLDRQCKCDPNLVSQLRQYERRAWEIGLNAHTIQMIISGRRLLGDRKCLQLKGTQSLY